MKELGFGRLRSEGCFSESFGKGLLTMLSSEYFKIHENKRVASIGEVFFIEGQFGIWIFLFDTRRSGCSKS